MKAQRERGRRCEGGCRRHGSTLLACLAVVAGACTSSTDVGRRSSPAPTLSQTDQIDFDFTTAARAELVFDIDPPNGAEFDNWVVGPRGVVLTVESDGGTRRRLEYQRFDGSRTVVLADWRPYGTDNDDWQIRGLTERFGLLQFITDTPSLRWELKRVDLLSGERVDIARSDEYSHAEPIISAILQRDLMVWVQPDASDDPCLFASSVESIEARRILCASEFGKVIIANPSVAHQSIVFVATARNGAGRGYEVPLSGGQPIEVAGREGTVTVERVGDGYLTYWIAPSVEADPVHGRNGVFLYKDGVEMRMEPEESDSPVACGRWAIWTGLAGRAGLFVQGVDPKTKETIVLISPDDGGHPSFSTCHGTLVATLEDSGDFESPVRIFRLPA